MIQGIARFVKDFGAEETAIRLLKTKYGEQIGKTSKTGRRAFKNVMMDGSEVITVLNKDYIVAGKLTKKGVGSSHVNYERLIYNYDGDVLVKTDVTKNNFVGKKPIYYYNETKYSEKYPGILEEQRRRIYNAETDDSFEVIIKKTR